MLRKLTVLIANSQDWGTVLRELLLKLNGNMIKVNEAKRAMRSSDLRRKMSRPTARKTHSKTIALRTLYQA